MASNNVFDWFLCLWILFGTGIMVTITILTVLDILE